MEQPEVFLFQEKKRKSENCLNHYISPPAQGTYVTRARSPLTLGCCSSLESSNMLDTNQVFAEVPHLLAEMWLPRLRHAAARRGESDLSDYTSGSEAWRYGFPPVKNRKNMNMKIMENMDAKIITSLFTKSGISCYEFENMDLGTHA
ncbi:hypothetical protein CsSME_00008343 [Camellia sinensis var. sinensis]